MAEIMDMPGYRGKSAWLALAACVLVPAAVYSGVLKAPFVFDDSGYVVFNPDIRSLDPSRLLYRADHVPPNRNNPTRPLTSLSFALNYRANGLAPAGYHAVNLALHVSVVIAAFLLAGKLLRHACGCGGVLLPLYAALLFAVHPVNAEVAAYVSHRSESLAAFFYLLSLLLFARYREREGSSPVPSLFCFALALCAKETAVTLPAVLLLADRMFLNGTDASRRPARKPVHPYFWALLAAYVLFRTWFFRHLGDVSGVTDQVWTHASYFRTQITVVTRYLGLLLFPVGQTVDHAVRPVGSWLSPSVWLSLPAWAALAGALALAGRGSRPRGKLLLFSAGWFLITLSSTSSFMPILDAMAERRLYLPFFGFSLASAAVLAMVLKAGPDGDAGKSARRRFALAAALHLLALASAARLRADKFADPAALWKEAIAAYPGNYRAYNNLGKVYSDMKEYDLALPYFRKALEIAPDYYLAYKNLGDLYYFRNDHAAAETYYRKSIGLNPENYQAYNNLAMMLINVHGRFAEAAGLLEKAAEIAPLDTSVYGNLGAAYYNLGEMEKAEAAFSRSIGIDPRQPEAAAALEQVRSRLRR